MRTSDIDRVVADLEALAAGDVALTAPDAVRARVMAEWDARAAAAPRVALRWWSYAGLAAVSAAAVLLAVAIDRTATSMQKAAGVVEIVDGGLSRILEGRVQPLSRGEPLKYGVVVRTNGGAGSQLRLADGSRVEMRSRSELSLERAAEGVQIRLASGGIIVQAAKQRAGHLYVRTRDMTVSVVGTVFLVKAEDAGSRVAVIEGEVEVQHGGTAQQIGPGQQVLTSAALEPIPVRQEIAWSRRAASHAYALQAALQGAPAQPRPEFEVADVRASEPRADGRSVLQMEGGSVRGGRYEVHTATLVDLIATAYGVRIDAVIGGPAWLAVDRYDVIAKPPDDAAPPSLNRMLQSLLEDRFRLVARTDTRPMPAWVLSRGAGQPNLRPANGADESACRPLYNINRLACRNTTLDAFVAWLRGRPGTLLPVVNATGIDGAWDFDIDGLDLARLGGVSDTSPIRDAIDKQLGLRLERQDIAQSVVVVDSVMQNPTANAPDVVARLPPDPDRFEVASIRPCQFVNPLTTGGLTGQGISPSGQVTTGCMPLSAHVGIAWNLGNQFRAVGGVILRPAGGDNIAGAPGWMRSRSFDIVAKAPIALTRPLVTDAKYRVMLRNLLIERFKMVTHYEDRVGDVYTLVATTPRLKKADASSRVFCTSSGIVPNAPTVVICQNVTMAQFADELNHSMAIANSGRPILDETGMQGTWDVTLSYRYRPAPVTPPGVASEPTGDESIPEALERQLGLKLQEARRPVPVFVIDRIEENPTEN